MIDSGLSWDASYPTMDGFTIDPGSSERRELWRMYGYLAAVEVASTPHWPELIHAVGKYL